MWLPPDPSPLMITFVLICSILFKVLNFFLYIIYIWRGSQPSYGMIFIYLHIICMSQYYMTVVQGPVFSADPSGSGLSYFQYSSRFSPSVPIVATGTQSSGELSGPVIMRCTFHYDVRVFARRFRHRSHTLCSAYRFAGILLDACEWVAIRLLLERGGHCRGDCHIVRVVGGCGDVQARPTQDMQASGSIPARGIRLPRDPSTEAVQHPGTGDVK